MLARLQQRLQGALSVIHTRAQHLVRRMVGHGNGVGGSAIVLTRYTSRDAARRQPSIPRCTADAAAALALGCKAADERLMRPHGMQLLLRPQRC